MNTTGEPTGSVVEEQPRFVELVLQRDVKDSFSRCIQDCFLAIFGCFLCCGNPLSLTTQSIILIMLFRMLRRLLRLHRRHHL